MDVGRALSNARERLAAAGDAARAVKEKAYLKSDRRHRGVSLPALERLAKELRREHADASPAQLVRLAKALWAGEYWDECMLAVKLLQNAPECLEPSLLPFLERMLREGRGWALVDETAIHLVGAVIEKHAGERRRLENWAKDEDFWLRRAALLAPLLELRRGEGDPALFFRLAEPMVEDPEFFIRKAIGWGVREIAKKRPDEAIGFLRRIRGRASPLTLREGAKHLPEEARAALLARPRRSPAPGARLRDNRRP